MTGQIKIDGNILTEFEQTLKMSIASFENVPSVHMRTAKAQISMYISAV